MRIGWAGYITASGLENILGPIGPPVILLLRKFRLPNLVGLSPNQKKNGDLLCLTISSPEGKLLASHNKAKHKEITNSVTIVFIAAIVLFSFNVKLKCKNIYDWS